MARPRVLIEEDFPVEALGVESRRENSTGQHPAPNRLHVWWARRPLTVSRAAVLASLLPADTDPTWFLRVLGIKGDPVAARQRMLDARAKGERVPGDLYGYKRAFSTLPDREAMERIQQELLSVWGTQDLFIMDPMAGGGSIPFEAMRLGFKTISNDLNPVAHIVERATLEYPRMFGPKLAPVIKHYSQLMHTAGQKQLTSVFPSHSGGVDLDYIWAHVVKCASCGYEIPLSPNWWIRRDDNDHLAVRPIVEPGSARPAFTLVNVKDEPTYDPDQGTVKRGSAVCPNCHNLTDGEEIKRQAQAGKMGYQLYAVVYTTGKGRSFRLPNPADEVAVQTAESLLAQKLPEWEAKGWVPTEEVYPGFNTNQIRNYGVHQWKDMFAPRQLLSLLTYLVAFQEIKEEVFANHPFDEARAVLTYLAFAIDKSADYNSRMTHFDGTRNKIANTFDRHDYAFKWSFAEMNVTAQGLGFDWAVDQVLDAYQGLCKLLGHKGNLQWFEQAMPDPVIRLGSATDLYDVADESIHAVVVDPPYYDNVMYSEMADFFYVWQRRTISDLYPEAFGDEFTPKDQEAIANRSRFAGKTKEAENLAKLFYWEDGGKLSTVNTSRKAPWMLAIILASLALDEANVLRLIHGRAPGPALVPWAIAVACTLALAWLPQRKSWWRVAVWILLGLTTFSISVLSDGTNLSLWTVIAVAWGPVVGDSRRRVTAGILWLAHAVAQFTLLPLHIGTAGVVYTILAGTGILATLAWHHWGPRPACQQQTSS